jgi:anti-sigma factor RsiW
MRCARVLVLLEAYVDDDLTPRRRQHVETHLQQCADCARQLQGARALQTSLRQLPPLQAPEALRQRLQAAGAAAPAAGAATSTAAAAAPPASRHWQDRLADMVSHTWDVLSGKHAGSAGWLRPAAVVAVLALIVLVWAQQRQPEQSAVVADATYSEEEVMQAHDQARWALAYLANITARAGDEAFIEVGDVMGQVIGEHVVGSVTDAVDRSLKPRSESKEPSTLEEEVQAP